MALDQTFREHEGDDYLGWIDESADEMEGYLEALEDADEAHPVTALSAFSLSAWLSR